MMKLTFGWLEEHLDTARSLDEIAGKLTMIGLEVERIEEKAKLFAPFVIARVVEAKPHPNADRLRVCMVDTGDGKPIQVVCGAPNARTGMKGVFAPPGAFIPGKNLTLGVGKSATSKAAACWCRSSSCKSQTITKALSSSPTTRRSGCLTLNMPGSTTR